MSYDVSSDQELWQELMDSFRVELAERLAAANVGLLALEQTSQGEQQDKILQELFRHVHSLKGAARAVNLHPIEKLTHALEDAFGAVKEDQAQLTADLFDLIYQGFDLVGKLVAQIEAGENAESSQELENYIKQLSKSWQEQPRQTQTSPGKKAPPTSDPTIQSWSSETIRVPTERLDDLMAQTSELLVARLQAAQRIQELKELYHSVAQWRREWQHVRNSAYQMLQSSNGNSSPLLAFLEQNQDHLRSLSTWITRRIHHLSDDLTHLSLTTDVLQEGVRQARMLPFANLLGIFRRMVRDLSREKGKEVQLEILGGETEMDKHVLEQIQDPLMHLLRNSIDHGIELPPERENQAKPRQGTILLSAERQGSSIVLKISDDGAGIDPKQVRRAAVQRGLLDAETLEAMSKWQIVNLIFTSGLSTTANVTQVSGRGIGLDVVRKNIEALQGQVEVYSTLGQGATFVLTLPLTLVSTNCFFMRVAGNTYAVPLAAVERLLIIDPADIVTVEGKQAVRRPQGPLALARLADVLQLSGQEQTSTETEGRPAVVLKAGGTSIAFFVDEMIGEQEVVIKSLGQQLARVPNVAAATVLGSGQVIIVLNVADLIQNAQYTDVQVRQPTIVHKQPGLERKHILIVDDSITTRTLEKNILTTAGYRVRLSTNGEEALITLAEGVFNLIVADVDMPRMDGIELTRQVKQDERYQHIPVILVTSLDSPEDKARGAAAGADAYIGKDAFDQRNLLDTIEQLI